MPKLFYVPIEPYEERYSAQWIRWFEAKFKYWNIDYEIIYGKSLSASVSVGAVFNPVSISHYRATQLAKIHKLIATGKIKDGDVIFFDDGQFPGVEQIAHYLPQIGLNVRLYSFFHAGTWIETDYVNRFGLARWMKWEERAWFEIFDKIFVATKHHYDEITKTLPEYKDKIVITGEPFCSQEIEQSGTQKVFSKRTIELVYPFRCDPEKGVDTWLKIVHTIRKKLNRPVTYCHTYLTTTNKQEYYNTLGNSKIILSTATEETFGIATAEAVIMGCIPILPKRCAYPDIYPEEFLYTSIDEAVEKCIKIINLSDTQHQKLSNKLKLIVKKFDNSIDRILYSMELI